MAIVFRCPECQNKFRVDEAYAGKSWQCTNCSASVTIPRPENLPVESLESRPRRGRERDEVDDMDMVSRDVGGMWGSSRLGLGILSLAVVILLIPFLLFSGLISYTTFAPDKAAVAMQRGGWLSSIAIAIVIAMMIAGLVTLILWIVGQGLCCSAPAGGVRGLAISSLICTVVTVLLLLIGFILLLTMDNRDIFGRRELSVVVVLILLGGITGLTAHILCTFFLRTVAVQFNRQSLALHVLIYFGLHLIYVVAYITTSLTMGLNQRFGNWQQSDASSSAIVAMVLLILGCVFMVWFTVLLNLTRSAIPKPKYYKEQVRSARDWYE